MKRIQFTELVNRQRRNLMGGAFLMIGVVYFEIEIKDGALLGLSLSNFDTHTALTTLLIFILYHAVAFGVGACEEYKHWRLTFSGKQAAAWGGLAEVTISSKLEAALPAIETLSSGTDDIAQAFKKKFGPDPFNALKDAVDAVLAFETAFNSFPDAMKLRFWALDICLPFAFAGLSVAFYCCSLR